MGFKKIPEYPRYSINELGEVYSEHCNRVITTYLTNKGYICVKLHLNGTQKTVSVHRLLARVFLDLPSLDSDMEVDHKDTIKTNNTLSNLQVLDFTSHRNKTISDNNQTIREKKFCQVCNKRLDSRNQSDFCLSHKPKPRDSIDIEYLEYLVTNFSWLKASKELGISDTGLRKIYKSLTGKDPKDLKRSTRA